MIVGKWWVSLKYNLINATNKDTDYIKKSKLYNIFSYVDDLPKDEVMRINNYVDEHIPVEITDYKIIMCNKNKVGCLLVAKKEDGAILDEIYLEEEYRNKGIGTDIIKNILKINPIVYLWVYKKNIKAISLYKKMKFKIINKTENRYYIKYSK